MENKCETCSAPTSIDNTDLCKHKAVVSRFQLAVRILWKLYFRVDDGDGHWKKIRKKLLDALNLHDVIDNCESVNHDIGQTSEWRIVKTSELSIPVTHGSDKA